MVLFWPFLAAIQIDLKLHGSVAYHLSKWVHAKIECFFFVNPQSNMISDMPVILQKF